MSEHDAHAALTATARLRIMAEPVEDAQLMTFSERQYRAREARGLQIAGMVADTVQAQVDAIVDEQQLADAARGKIDWAAQRVADFRDGRCVHGESHFTCPICGVQMGRRDNE